MTGIADAGLRLRQRADALLKVSDLPPAPSVEFAEGRDERVPLVGVTGSVNSGKSSLLNAVIGDSIAAVADRDHSSHPIFVGYGESEFFGYKLTDGAEVEVPRATFLKRLCFDEKGRRDVSISNGIVRKRLETLQRCEFVDLPGLGGAYSEELDSLTLETLTACPMAIVAFTRLGSNGLELIGKLASQGVATLCVRTKSDLELRSDDPDTLRDVQFEELGDMLERDIVTVNMLTTTQAQWSGDYGVIDAAVFGQRLAGICDYYRIAKACAKFRGDVGRLRQAGADNPKALRVELDVAAIRATLLSVVKRQPGSGRTERSAIVAECRKAVGGASWYDLRLLFGPAAFPDVLYGNEPTNRIDAWLSNESREATRQEWIAKTLLSLERTYLPLSHDLHLHAAAILASVLGDNVQARWLLKRVKKAPLFDSSLFPIDG